MKRKTEREIIVLALYSIEMSGNALGNCHLHYETNED